MEVSGAMCISHALCPLSLAAIWMPELTQHLHCECVPEEALERERERGRETVEDRLIDAFNICVMRPCNLHY